MASVDDQLRDWFLSDPLLVIAGTIGIILVVVAGLWLSLRPRYVAVPCLLSDGERRFSESLERAVPAKLRLLCKVRVADLVAPRMRENSVGWMKTFGPIVGKHVDFVFVDQGYRPVCAVELDDRSHLGWARKRRDRLLDRVFRTAKLPLLHVKVVRRYDVPASQQMIEQVTAVLAV